MRPDGTYMHFFNATAMRAYVNAMIQGKDYFGSE